MFHFTIHAALAIRQVVVVQSTIHTMVGFAVPHMFIVHTKAESLAVNTMSVQ